MSGRKTPNKIILIQPKVGFSGEFVRHIPLSLLYVASGLTKEGFDVVILDNRLAGNSWKTDLAGLLKEDALFVGITVMSGSPIANAIEASKIVRSISDVPVVWGGAHPTVMPRQILAEDFVDFTVSGSGVSSVVKLARALQSEKKPLAELEKIPGLGYKHNGAILLNSPYEGFEHVHYKDIPYSLVRDMSPYGQIGSDGRVFPIFGAYGCVYQCSFCISPRLYRNFNTKWMPLSSQEVAEHIGYLKDNYGASEIYFYDDDSFINLDHVHNIIKEVKARGISVKMSFRGARVNEVLRMDQKYLDELSDAGTHILHIGIESGSQRILDLFKKGIKVNDIIDMNRLLAKNKHIIAFYNWILGTPTETAEDVLMSMDLVMRLIEENPRCCIFPPNKFRPLPATDLFDLAIEHGYKEPAALEDWIGEELEGDKAHPWYTPAVARMIRMAQVASYCIDNKPELLFETRSWKNEFIKLICRLYRPLARYRFRHNMTFGLIEYPIYNLIVSRYRR